jgi:hypothetical protein
MFSHLVNLFVCRIGLTNPAIPISKPRLSGRKAAPQQQARRGWWQKYRPMVIAMERF